MNAGGLAPPPPLTDANAGAGAAGPGTPPPSSADIRGDLDDSKDKDSGRGLSWFWVEVQGGFEHLGLQTFNVDEQALTAGLVKTSASGGVLSAGIGAQLIFLTLGVRGRMGFFDPGRSVESAASGLSDPARHRRASLRSRAGYPLGAFIVFPIEPHRRVLRARGQASNYPVRSRRRTRASTSWV
jgi:hypothetical protein